MQHHDRTSRGGCPDLIGQGTRHVACRLLPLCFFGIASLADAQSFVRINAATSECTVTNPPAGNPVFRIDSQGNVLVNGILGGPGCGGLCGVPSFFNLNPLPADLTISPDHILVGGSATINYRAYYATSCVVHSTPGIGCPALTLSNESCTGSGSPLSCSPSAATVSEMADLPGVTSCDYTLQALCTGISTLYSQTAVVNVSNVVSNPCQNLAPLGTGIGNWSRQVAGPVTYADGTTSPTNVDWTSYTATWSEAATIPWPGASGLSTRLNGLLSASYVAEQFVAPMDGSVPGAITWVNSTGAQGYSPTNNAASYSISTCKGDFGQPGTQLGANCSADISSAVGLAAKVANSPQAGYCTLAPGKTYFLNVVQGLLNNVAVTGNVAPSCQSGCAPWTRRQ